MQVQRNWEVGNYHETSIEGASTKTRPEAQPQAQNVGQGIYCIQFDEVKIVSGGRDHRVKQWNIDTYELEREFVGHTGSVLCLQFDDTKVISGSSDTKIMVWDMATGARTGVLGDHEQSVLHLNFNENRLVSCSKDKLIIVWRWDDSVGMYIHEHTLEGHKAAVNVVEFDHRFIVSASGDRSIRIWHTDTGQELEELRGHDRGIACLQFQDDYIVSGSSDKSLKIWHINSDALMPDNAISDGVQKHSLLRTLTGHDDLVRCVRFDVQMDRIVSGSYDSSMIVWSFHDGRLLFKIGSGTAADRIGHSNRVFRVQFDAHKIVSSSQDDTIRVWDMAGASVVGASDPMAIEEGGGGGSSGGGGGGGGGRIP